MDCGLDLGQPGDDRKSERGQQVSSRLPSPAAGQRARNAQGSPTGAWLRFV